jgi:pantoate--beta-alanine ligase
MRIARSFSELRTFLPVFRNRPLWLVPTRGALHDGHGALVDRARQENGFVAVSIFVNPLQFGPTEDLDRYPRTEEADLSFLDRRGADLVFLPSAREILPPTSRITVSSGAAGQLYCGRSRPGHFDGVLTIVIKLFHLFRPEYALFGEKDRQQLFLIRSMVRDLNLSTEVLGHPTVREHDGLAMSSRNRYLSPDERLLAGRFPELLDKVARGWSAEEQKSQAMVDRLLKGLTQDLSGAGFRVDYVAIANRDTLLPVTDNPVPENVLLLAAVFLGNTRLIDNRELVSPAPASPAGISRV